MVTMPRALRSLLASSALAASTIGCAGAASGTADTASLEAALRKIIGSAACERNDQCRTIPYGAKACGGPQSYLAWSTLNTDEAALRAAADKFAVSQREEVERKGLVSNCSMVVDPGAYCSAGDGGAKRACRLNPRGRAAAQ